jgi:hypothetical protein
VTTHRSGPALDPDYALFLFFPTAKTADVLQAVSEFAANPVPRRTGLLLPDGRTITVPFRSWLSHGAHSDRVISLSPRSRVRLDTLLAFPTGQDVEESPEPKTGGGPAPAWLDRGSPLSIRLWVYMGQRHVGLVFFPADPQAGRLLIESTAIHRALFQLLECHEGILGLLSDGADETTYLLPDLRTGIDTPDLFDYYNANEGIDVDGMLEFFLQQTGRPTLPPTAKPPDQGLISRADPEELAKVLDRLMGSWREAIPQRYHRTFEERPFDACDFCAKALLVPGSRYTITKVFSEGELRQELAICYDCAQELERGYSKESRQATARLLFDISPFQRLSIAGNQTTDRAERLTRDCLICREPKDASPTYVEYAMCEGTEIVYQIYPFIVCEPCLLRINDALSDQTREAWRRFYDDHFGFPTPGAPGFHSEIAPEYHILQLW